MSNYYIGSSLLGKLGYFPSLFLSLTEMKQRILVVVSLIDRQSRLEPSVTRIILRLFRGFAFTKSCIKRPSSFEVDSQLVASEERGRK